MVTKRTPPTAEELEKMYGKASPISMHSDETAALIAAAMEAGKKEGASGNSGGWLKNLGLVALGALILHGCMSKQNGKSMREWFADAGVGQGGNVENYEE